jgi:transposase
MGVCYRQAKRLLARYQREGLRGLAHRQRGQPARNAFGPETHDLVLALHREGYAQFNDTRFVEMLEEREGLRIGRETVCGWHVLCMVMREAGDARD